MSFTRRSLKKRIAHMCLHLRVYTVESGAEMDGRYPRAVCAIKVVRDGAAKAHHLYNEGGYFSLMSEAGNLTSHDTHFPTFRSNDKFSDKCYTGILSRQSSALGVISGTVFQSFRNGVLLSLSP